MLPIIPSARGIFHNIAFHLFREFLFLFLALNYPVDLRFFLNFRQHSKSQLFQDLFVIAEIRKLIRSNNLKMVHKNYQGFFVEFGATNGLNLSNTWMLENKMQWRGILAEPAICWHSQLFKNRNCAIDKRCVYRHTGTEVLFEETEIPELSTLHPYSNKDVHSNKRINAKKYSVETVSLNDLLETYNAPFMIDYISIDTEGSELDILKHFNFTKNKILIFTIEHNFTSAEKEIDDLMAEKGYRRKFRFLTRFDAWYVLK